MILDILNREIENYKSYADKFNNITIPDVSDTISSLMGAKKQLESNIKILENIDIPECKIDIIKAVERELEPEVDAYRDKRNKILEKQRNLLAEEHERYEQTVALQSVKKKEIIAPIRTKHEKLLRYKDQLADILTKYNISPSDIKISDDITREEFEAMLDDSIKTMESMCQSRDKILKIVKWPLMTEKADSKFKIYYLVFLFFAFYLLSPFLSVGVFCYMFLSTSTVNKKIDSLRIAESLMQNIDYTRFLDENELPKAVEDTDNIKSEISNDIEKLEEENPFNKLEELKRELPSYLETITKECSKATKYVKDSYKYIYDLQLRTLEKVNIEIDNYLKNLKTLGSTISESNTLSYNFIIGRIDNAIDVIAKYELSNMVFNSNMEDIISVLKVYYCNILLNVKEKHLYTTVYDPDNLCADFADFYTNDISEYISLVNENFDNTFKKLRDIAQNNVKVIGDSNIQEYNRECERIGKTAIDYRLLIILSDTKTAYDAPGFSKFMEYSARYGVIVWIVDSNQLANTIFISKYDAEGERLYYTQELGIKVMQTYCKAFENSSIDVIYYKKDYLDKILPREKWWTYSTKKGIELNIGYEDGDPSKAYPYIIGDSNVHVLMGGMTGAGKSVTLNQALLTLTTKYSPNELMLIMSDLKNAEFASFSKQDDAFKLNDGTVLPTISSIKQNHSIIPHAKVLSGTKDGEYALSVFDFAIEEMTRRTELFAKASVKNIIEYRTKFPDAVMPRVLIMIDEFQVMFTEVEQKIVDKISDRIRSLAKLARFVGIHMLFTSQSMVGTISPDIMGQFSLRLALFCDAKTSEAILGNVAASKLKTMKGSLVANDSNGQRPERNKTWRIPYANNDDIYSIMEELNVLCKKHNMTHYDALFYNQTTTYSDKILNLWYDKVPVLKDPKLMLLGEKTYYSSDNAPVHFKLTNDDGENIICVAFEREDMLNLVMTFVDNIKRKDNAVLLMNSADRESFELLDMPNLVDSQFIDIASPKVDMAELLESLNEIIEYRKTKSIAELEPIYFIAVQWEKAKLIAVDSKSKYEDLLARILSQAPNVGMHFIFVGKELGEFPVGLLKKFSHRIAAKCGEIESSRYIDSPRAFLMKDRSQGVFAIYKYGTTDYKFKVYQHKFTRELESRTIKITESVI